MLRTYPYRLLLDGLHQSGCYTLSGEKYTTSQLRRHWQPLFPTTGNVMKDSCLEVCTCDDKMFAFICTARIIQAVSFLIRMHMYTLS
jgi:hypothetical protein